ncbi:MAG TPA: hypothetical protein VNI36_07810 [Candidatus Dormibacteraeota bacterium]|nr:hypothetical protein [Candidatus Dormibacteraeota bacterium]
MKLRTAACIVLLLSLAAACGTPAHAQEMLPEQSTAKAKQVLQQVIAALGGQAYLNVRDIDCQGRVAQYGTHDQLMGFTSFRDLWLLPEKNRTEYIAKGQDTILKYLLGVDGLAVTHGGVLIRVFNGNQGWMLDKGGVSDEPGDLVKQFDEQVKSGMNDMLRSRMNEPGVEILYGGPDVIDLKEAEWIDFSDRDQRDMRLAVDKMTHLPLRWVVTTRDPETRRPSEAVTSYTQYISLDGVKTPLSIVHSRDGRKLSQTFLTGCKYNSDLDANLFTRASLEHRAPGVTKKGYKNTKDKN